MEIPSVGFLSYKQHKGLPWWFRWWGICLPMQETQIQSLGQKDPLEEEMATHNFLPGEFHGQRSYSPWGHKQLDTTEQLTHTHNIKTFTQIYSAGDQVSFMKMEYSHEFTTRYSLLAIILLTAVFTNMPFSQCLEQSRHPINIPSGYTLPFTQHTPSLLCIHPELYCQVKCFFCLFCCPNRLLHLW